MIENESASQGAFYIPEKRRPRRGVVRGVFIGVLLAFALTFFSFLLASQVIGFPAAPVEVYIKSTQPKKQLVAFVGVQTGFTKTHASQKYTYENRRNLLRETWFPSPKSALDKFEEESGIRVRFVIGLTSDEAAEGKVKAEQEEHDDFVRLDFEESYKNLALKTLMFLRYVVDNFDVQYIAKADDDVYLALHRLLLAMPQWRERDADWMHDARTQVFRVRLGSLYVLSGQATEILRHIPDGKLRLFNNEDATVGGWMDGCT